MNNRLLTHSIWIAKVKETENKIKEPKHVQSKTKTPNKRKAYLKPTFGDLFVARSGENCVNNKLYRTSFSRRFYYGVIEFWEKRIL